MLHRTCLFIMSKILKKSITWTWIEPMLFLNNFSSNYPIPLPKGGIAQCNSLGTHFERFAPYLVWATSRELPVLCIEHHIYHNHHLRAFLRSFAPLPTLPQLSLGCERAAIRVSLSDFPFTRAPQPLSFEMWTLHGIFPCFGMLCLWVECFRFYIVARGRTMKLYPKTLDLNCFLLREADKNKSTLMWHLGPRLWGH